MDIQTYITTRNNCTLAALIQEVLQVQIQDCRLTCGFERARGTLLPLATTLNIYLLLLDVEPKATILL